MPTIGGRTAYAGMGKFYSRLLSAPTAQVRAPHALAAARIHPSLDGRGERLRRNSFTDLPAHSTWYRWISSPTTNWAGPKTPLPMNRRQERCKVARREQPYLPLPQDVEMVQVQVSALDQQEQRFNTQGSGMELQPNPRAARTVAMLMAAAALFATCRILAPTATAGALLQLAEVPGSLWQGYCIRLEQHPVIVKGLTGLVGSFLGDLLAQWATHTTSLKEQQQQQALQQQQQQGLAQPADATGEASEKLAAAAAAAAAAGSAGHQQHHARFRYDVNRACRLLLFVVITNPILQFWYLLLDSAVMPSAPGAALTIVLKMAMDQCLLAPIMTMCFFFFMKLMEDLSHRPHGRQATWPSLLKRARDEASVKWLPTLLTSYMVWPLAHIINFALVPSSQRILYINVISIFWTAFMSWKASKPAGSK